jgi:hypothetical protein
MLSISLIGLSAHAGKTSGSLSNSIPAPRHGGAPNQNLAVDVRDTPEREMLASEAPGSSLLRRIRGRIPLRLATIADPLLITAVSQGLTRPLGRERPRATVFMTATIAYSA